MLQWGRVLMNAETTQFTPPTRGWIYPLQWGRVLMNAETAIPSLGVLHRGVRLQWGRVLMNAETYAQELAEDIGAMLQWGRVLMNAEPNLRNAAVSESRLASMGPRSHERGNTPHATRNVADVGVASMGPRSHERGNTENVYSATRTRTLLQWGRVLMNAETYLEDSETKPVSKLQWGRVLMNAETRDARRGQEYRGGRFNGAAFS